MAIRIRQVAGASVVAVCAARSVEKPGDIYLDDGAHHVLADKFREDFASEGLWPLRVYPELAALRASEESNNPNREWWERMYGAAREEEARSEAVHEAVQAGIDDGPVDR